MIIDCHTHLLPEIDDGARNMDISLEMLKREREQGVVLVIATPHFYADRDRMDSFLERRTKAYRQTILTAKKYDMEIPKIIVGSEVAYFNGIGRADGIENLTIRRPDKATNSEGDSHVMLLEMPFYPWNERVMEDVRLLTQEKGLTLVIAHLERYIEDKKNQAFIEELYKLPVLIQLNAESLTREGFFAKRASNQRIDMFRDGKAHLLGSDCHSLNRRPPNLIDGRKAIANRLGEGILQDIDNRCKELFWHLV